ncbi:MAG: hypothetical protein J6T10_32390 [Methanobrevibacter sp.]|nr:hypothetical protein [Methanobrevibacter sp.]
MGQRSQIYVRIKSKRKGIEKVDLIAQYYQWNFAERMISRAKYGIEWIKENVEYLDWEDKQIKLGRILDTNFNMIDVVLSSNIIKEYEDWVKNDDDKEDSINNSEGFKDFVFIGQDNNDGKLFIDVDVENKTVKFCLTDYDLKILSPKEYMDWDYEDWRDSEYLPKEARRTCEDNIEYLETIEQMTEEELKDFVDYDYWLDMNKPLF